MGERTVPGTDVALTIAGSDSSGGAGIAADLKTFSVLGVYGAAVITAVTAQNTRGVQRSLILEADMVAQQIASVAGDIEVRATKTGMLGSAAVVEAVVDAIKGQNLFPLVVDPVMVARGGASLIDDQAVAVLRKKLLPLATVATPNRAEAARLLDQSKPIEGIASGAAAAKEICKRFGVKNCIVKGFKRDSDREGQAVDIFYDGNEVHEVVSEWRPTENTHGSGCTFSAAIAAAMARGQELAEAIQVAKALISEAIRQNCSIGHGNGPVNPLAYLKLKG